LKFLICLCSFIASFSFAKTKTLHFNISTKPYPPYIVWSQNSKEEPSGIMTDTLKGFCKSENITLSYQKVPRARVDDFIRAGELDLTARAMEWTKNLKDFVFTDPVTMMEDTFFHLSGNKFSFKKPDDLDGKSIGIIVGYRYPKLATKIKKKKISISETISESSLIDMIRFRRIEAAIMDRNVGLWNIKKKPNAKIIPHGTPLNKAGYRFMFNKKYIDLVEKFNTYLKKINADKSLNKTIAKYITQ